MTGRGKGAPRAGPTRTQIGRKQTGGSVPIADRPDRKTRSYVLRLFISGTTPRSRQSILDVKAICDRHVAKRYTLEVVDLYQQPDLAAEDQVVVAPTLLRKFPLPVRRVTGNLVNSARILKRLGIH